MEDSDIERSGPPGALPRRGYSSCLHRAIKTGRGWAATTRPTRFLWNSPQLSHGPQNARYFSFWPTNGCILATNGRIDAN